MQIASQFLTVSAGCQTAESENSWDELHCRIWFLFVSLPNPVWLLDIRLRLYSTWSRLWHVCVILMILCDSLVMSVYCQHMGCPWIEEPNQCWNIRVSVYTATSITNRLWSSLVWSSMRTDGYWRHRSQDSFIDMQMPSMSAVRVAAPVLESYFRWNNRTFLRML